MSAMSQYLKNTVGFNVYTQDDPDLLTWLYTNWKDKNNPDDVTNKVVIDFIKSSKELISQKPVVAMEYIDTGIAVILSTGEKIPFNKSSTITSPSVSINVMGPTEMLASPRTENQIDTSAPITGGK